MEGLFKLWTAYLAVGIEASAGAIIGLAALEAIYKALTLFFTRKKSPDDLKEEIRLNFGGWLSLALEFEQKYQHLKQLQKKQYSPLQGFDKLV
jgi:uncharacterized membrane protein